MSASTVDVAAAESPKPAGADALRALADQCVKCGLCLPHCPTYRVHREEGESPRGRIAFAQHLAAGGAPSARMLEQLDDCLACGSCEAVCPSHVRYLTILDEVRARIRKERGEPRWRGWLRGVAARGGTELAALLALARIARRLGFAKLLGAGAPGRLAALAGGMRARGAGPVAFAPASGVRRGALAVFRGCVASVTDADTQLATVDVLARIGFDVHAPAGALCCGALARHAGDTAGAAARAHDAAQALADCGAERVVGTASGCQRDLVDRVLVEAGIRGTDVMTLIDADPAFAALPLRPLERRVAWLVPCTETPGAAAATARVLARIPGLDVVHLPLQPRCCGAAGFHFADHAAIAEPLRAERLAQIRAAGVAAVLTTNVGCRMYLEAGLAGTPVLHPIALVAEALAPTP